MIIKIFQFRHVCIVFLFKAIYESPVILWTFGLKLAYFFLCLLVMLGDEFVYGFLYVLLHLIMFALLWLFL